MAMEVHSLQVLVPTKKCVNRCPFCVSGMCESSYKNQIEDNKRFSDLYERDYIDRLIFARENGCNTMVITGDGEALQNIPFLRNLAHWNALLGEKRFRWIELQTTGVFLDDEMLRFLRNTIRVSTIALSASDLFDTDNNDAIIGIPVKLRQDFEFLCSEIKRYDFNLRISVNLTDVYNNYSVTEIFERLKKLGADQVLFRTLYDNGDKTPQTKWVREHSTSQNKIDEISDYIIKNGTALEPLPFGARRYSVNGISSVLDQNCMIPQELRSEFRYLILRQNSRLYSRWSDAGSLLF